MIGLTNEKTALQAPVPETKTNVDNLFYRKDNQNRESGRTGFEDYLKAAVTDKSKPFRETGLNSADHGTMDRRQERLQSKRMESKQVSKDDRGPQNDAVQNKPGQVAKDDNGPEKDPVQNKPDDTGEVSAQAPDQTETGDTSSQTGDTANAGVQALSLNPVVQMPIDDQIQLTGDLTGVQPANTVAGNDATQLPVNVSAGELLNKPETAVKTSVETTAEGQQTLTSQQTATAQQTAATQNAVDAFMGLAQDPNSANGQTVADSNQAMTAAMEALMGTESKPKDTSARETSNQSQSKATATTGSGLKGAVLNSNVLEVFQDKVVAQAAIQNLSHSKEELQQSLQNAVTGKALAAGTENKPLNLAVLQTQLAVGENADQTNTALVTPLQQHQTAAGQFQEVTGMTAPNAGKDQLFTQIMDHAKLMLSGNQSELEMSLKPEHLGKLQLKVLVENQVVTARFVAESQQVKQIIETNLNQLRDQLRESGLMVDHLSVSVGNGTNQQLFDQTAGNQSQFGSSPNSHSYSEDLSDFSMTGEAAAAPKSLQDTVIDLIA
jgi:flagellar hook-length control protein FliK